MPDPSGIVGGVGRDEEESPRIDRDKLILAAWGQPVCRELTQLNEPIWPAFVTRPQV